MTWLLLAIGMAALVALAWFRSRWERGQLRAEFYQVPVPQRIPAGSERQNRNGCNGMADSALPLRVAFLSDLHDYIREYGSGKLTRVLQEAAPDLILAGGDMITCCREADWNAETELTADWLCGLAGQYPVIHGEGNHEARLRDRHPEAFAAYQGKLQEAGVLWLQDAKVRINGLEIYGITLDENFYRKVTPTLRRRAPMPPDLLLKKLGLPDPSRPVILLMHSPLYLKEAADWGADLVLSGHFHGGTIRLPLPGNPGLMTPQFQFFLRECSGMHTAGNGHTRMIVSRGIGTHSIKIRFRDLPEISIIDLVPAAEPG